MLKKEIIGNVDVQKVGIDVNDLTDASASKAIADAFAIQYVLDATVDVARLPMNFARPRRHGTVRSRWFT